jgi:succinate dehydrogenase flavin-adding protein (antitoxin of CptAB toxin-antitoxin module)
MSQGYPTFQQVEEASDVQLVSWVRGLPSPNDANRSILERILERHAERKKADPGAMVAASKLVGWS